MCGALFWCKIRENVHFRYISISLNQHTETHTSTIQRHSCNITSTQQLYGAGVLRLFGLQSIKLQLVINICLLYDIATNTCLGLFSDIVLVSTMYTSFY